MHVLLADKGFLYLPSTSRINSLLAALACNFLATSIFRCSRSGVLGLAGGGARCVAFCAVLRFLDRFRRTLCRFRWRRRSRCLSVCQPMDGDSQQAINGCSPPQNDSICSLHLDNQSVAYMSYRLHSTADTLHFFAANENRRDRLTPIVPEKGLARHSRRNSLLVTEVFRPGR